jgi:parallel beta-helix repeat protein
VLANDLIDCPGTGIVIGANDITLDLKSHTIDGNGVGDYAGVDNSAGHDGVTIKNGSVREFTEGVLIFRASENQVRDLSTTQQAHAGINVGESTYVYVAGNSSVDDCVGISVDASRNIWVERNAVADNNSVPDNTRCAAIPIFTSEHVHITGNSVSGSKAGSGIAMLENSDHNRAERNSISDGSDGIFLDAEADHNMVTGNSVSGSFFQGIFLGPGASHNVVSENSSFGNSDGIVLDGADHNLLSRNSLRTNNFSGLFVFNADDNLIDKNSVVGNSAGADGPEGGIRLFTDSEDPGSTSDHNVISKNTLDRNARDGILVDAGHSETLVEQNRSNENADDGIHVDSPATTLTANTADRNHDLGIEAVPGVTDGGGNKASGNGNPLQCTNVFCK